MDNGKRESIIKEHIARTPYNETHIASRSQILRHIAKQTESGVSHYLSSIEMPVDGRTTPPPPPAYPQTNRQQRIPRFQSRIGSEPLKIQKLLFAFYVSSHIG